MQFLDTVFYFVITLGVLVLVHELGHFLAAKLCKMRVERFSIGFPPRAFGKKIGETDYCVSWIPIGGYVKIAGMIDESFDTDFVNRPAEPWEFRAKPVWQRIFVLTAGVLMNILLAVAIFWGMNYTQGRVVRETTEIGAIVPGSPAEHTGLKVGDRVLALNGTPVSDWEELMSELFIESMTTGVNFTVLREGAEHQITIPKDSIPETNPAAFGIVPPHMEVVVNTVEPGRPAEKLGLKPADRIVSLDGLPVVNDKSLTDVVRAHAGQPLAVEWKHGEENLRGETLVGEDGRIGISFALRYTGPMKRVDYTLLEALPQGIRDLVNISSLFLQQLGQLVTGKTPFSQSVGGPIRIAQLATQSAELGLLTYLGFMALLSISLAILNILPIPALDGGHIAIVLVETLIRRELPINVKMGIQKVGFILLLAFMAFVVYNDIVHF
jgi:regulator of sigma E protease